MIRRLVALAISLGVRACDLAGGTLRRILDLPVTPRAVVLYYHAVRPSQRASFARQMDVLVKCGRPFPAGAPESISGETPNVAVTFDDGFRSVVENALPELVSRGIPFTMFVPTGCLGERPSWVRLPKHPSWDERVLSADELRALGALPLVTLGSHSMTHANLLSLDPPSAEWELTQSKLELERASGRPVELFSFPHGAHDAVLVERARAAGYRKVFTIQPSRVAPSPDAFALGRVATEPSDWPLEFQLKIVGAYRWRRLLSRRRRAS